MTNFLFKEQIDVALQQLEAIKKYFIENKKADTYSNIKLVHDYLVNTIEYDTSISKENIYNIYGALIQKRMRLRRICKKLLNIY